MAHDFVYFYAFNCIMVSVLLVFISLRFCSNCITYGLCSNCLVQNWILQQLHYPFRFCSNCITKLSISHYLPPHGWAVIVTLVTCQLSSQSSTQQTNAAMALHRGHPSIIGRVFASAIIGRRCQVARTIIGLARPTVTWGAHLVLTHYAYDYAYEFGILVVGLCLLSRTMMFIYIGPFLSYSLSRSLHVGFWITG